MRYSDIDNLLQQSQEAKEYFDTLPAHLREGLLAHGSGINNLSELKHFAGIMESRGGRP